LSRGKSDKTTTVKEKRRRGEGERIAQMEVFACDKVEGEQLFQENGFLSANQACKKGGPRGKRYGDTFPEQEKMREKSGDIILSSRGFQGTEIGGGEVVLIEQKKSLGRKRTPQAQRSVIDKITSGKDRHTQ